MDRVGYIKLHRRMLDWEWKTKPLTLALFIHLLKSASYRENNWRGISLNKGQLVTGRRKLSDETGLSERQIRTALNHLKSTNEVTIKATKEYSIITIVNWDLYQSSDQQTANERPSSDQAATTTKEGKEIKEDKENKNICFEDLKIEHIASWLGKKRANNQYVEIDEYKLLERFQVYCRKNPDKYTDCRRAFMNAFSWENPPLKKKKANQNSDAAYSQAAVNILTGKPIGFNISPDDPKLLETMERIKPEYEGAL